MSKNRILLLTYNTVNKGTYFRAFSFAKFLACRNYEVHLITTSNNSRFSIREYYKNGIRIIEMPDLLSGSFRSGWDIWNIFRRLVWLFDKKYDLVHAFDSRPTVLIPSIFLQKIRKIPLIMDWADWFGKGGSVEQRSNKFLKILLRPLETFFEQIYRSSVDFNTIICNPLIDRAIDLGINKDKIKLLPNGCDSISKNKVGKLTARKIFGFYEDHKIIGHIGTIFKEDAQFAIQAFDILHEQNPKIILLLIGYCPFDLRSFSKFPEAVFQKKNIADEDQISSLLSCCDIGWLPLRNSIANKGRLPLKMFDYISAGLPIVSTKVGDMTFYIENFKIGLTCDVDLQKFVYNSNALLSNPYLQDLFSQNEMYISENELNWREVGKILISIYNSQIFK